MESKGNYGLNFCTTDFEFKNLVMSPKNFKWKKNVKDIQENLAMQQCPKVHNAQYNSLSTFATI